MRAKSENTSSEVRTPVELGAFGFDDGVDGWLERFRSAGSAEVLGDIGPYEVLAEVGRGGQGVVYRSRQRGDGKVVALKRLAFAGWESMETRRRFAREISAVAALSHPNIVTHVAMKLIDGHPLLVMEWIDGQPITQWAQGRQMAPRGVVEVFLKCCDAVHHAHQRGIIHRDLKPANILVDGAGEPHILDFGLAKLIDPAEGDAGATQTQQFLGTPAYASPEQLGGGPEAIDIRTDVYSLGVLLYELLAGRLPYDVRQGGQAGVEMIRHAWPARPSSRRGDVGRELDAIVLQAIATAPERRYPSVEALAADLRRYLAGEPVQAHPPSRWYALRKFAGRNRALVAVSVAMVAVLLVGSVIMGLQVRRTAEARKEERRARWVAERVSAFLGETLASPRASRRGANVKVMEVLEEASRRAATELADQPEVAAGVHYAIGTTYSSLWRWRDAQPHLEKALELTRPRHVGDEELAKCLTALGTVQTSLRIPQAVDTQREALELRKRLYSADHALVALSMTKLAYAMHQAAAPPQWENAEELFDEALSMYRRLHGDVHRDIGSCLHNYGWMRRRQRQFPEALAYYEDALRVFRALGDRDDPYYLECMHGLASLYNHLGHYEQNLDMLAESIPLTERTYSSEGVAPLWVERAQACLALGRLDEASTAFREVLVLQCNIIEQADPALREPARAVWLGLMASRGNQTVLPLEELTGFAQRLTDARKREWLTLLRQCGELLLRKGEVGDASRQLRAVLDAVETDFACSAIRPEALEGHADALLANGESEAALTNYEMALRLMSEGPMRGRWQIARVESKAGECLLKLGRIAEARDRLIESQKILDADYGPSNVQTISGAARIERLHALIVSPRE